MRINAGRPLCFVRIFLHFPVTICIKGATTPPTPLDDAPLGGFFIGFLMKFEKPSSTPREQITLLSGRGLIIDDPEKAEYYLRHIGYYRLSAYFIPFQIGPVSENPHQFRPKITFQGILDLYIFDRQLRLYFNDALERIEIAIRAMLTDHMAHNHGPHWFLNSSLFYNPLEHAKIIVKISNDVGSNNGGRKKGEAVRHYFKKYKDPSLPPTWVVMEELSIGTLSRLFKAIRNDEKHEIADYFKISCDVFESWLHSLTVLRNRCAHHSRTWNRTFPPIKIPRKSVNLGIQHAERIQGLICIIKYIVEKVSGDTDWHDRLTEHLNKCPVRYEGPMGFISS